MDFSSRRRFLVGLILNFALIALLQTAAVIAYDRTPIYNQFNPEYKGSSVHVVSIAETSDGVLFIGCRPIPQVLIFDGNNWDKVALPAAPCVLIADQNDRVWVTTDDGLGFIKRDAMGASHFQRFELEELKSDPIVFRVGFRTEGGVRFGNARMIADIDCSNNNFKTKLHRAQPHETFCIKDAQDIYVIIPETSELFRLEDGKRTVVATEFLPNGVFACRLPGNRYLFANSDYREFRVSDGDKWPIFSEDLQSRSKEEGSRWFKPLSDDRIGFATPESFACYDTQGELLWAVNEEVRRFGELSHGRTWLAGPSGFFIVERSDTARIFSLGSESDRIVKWIDVTKEGVFLSSNSGLFLLDLERYTGTFPKLESVKRLVGVPCNMTWHSGDDHLVATSRGITRIDGDRKKIFERPVHYGFTTSNQHYILSQEGGRVSVLDPDLKLKTNFTLSFNILRIIEESPTTYWILGNEGQLVVAQLDSKFLNCEIKRVEGLSVTSQIVNLDGDICVVTKDGLSSPELKPQPDNELFTLKLRDADERFSQLKEQFQKRKIREVIDCADSGLLLCGLNHLSMHKLVDGQYQADPIAELTIPGEFGKHIAWDPYRSVVWATFDKGLVALLPQPGESSKSFKPILKMAVAPEEAIHTGQNNEPFEIDAASNVSFRYGIPGANGGSPFQYRLRGLNEGWSGWTDTTLRNYDRLPYGKYSFEVRARKADGEIVSSTSDTFVVRKPWYATIPAIALLSLLAVGLVFGATSIRAKHLEARNKKMEDLIAIRTEEIQKQKVEIQEKSELLVQHYRNAESEKLKSFDTLVAGISHDFNNLLAVIATNSELVGLKFGEQGQQINENMQTAIQSAADLCGELRAISDTQHLNPADDSLGGVVEEILPVVQGTVAANVNVDVELCEDPTWVSIDVTGFKRAILNIVVNAAEVARHRILIETSVHDLNQAHLQDARFVGECPPPGKFACVSISDDGSGIRSEHLGRLFDPFFSTNELGRGLGLSIVMRVLASHNGVIFVEKSEFGGARFRLCLPLIEKTEPAKPDVPARVKDSKLKVLLVDDNSLVLESTRIIVHYMGHEVFTANSAAKGFEMLKETKDIDVLVLDVSMAEMSGVEMAAILLKEDQGFPIVFVSGYSHDLIRQDFLQLPNVDFLNKPYRTSALSEKISQVWATRCTTERNIVPKPKSNNRVVT